MKRHLFLPVILCGLFAATGYAQGTQDNGIKLQDLKLTSAPAFSLLDVSPSSIESPATTKAFAVSISDALAKSSGFPQNYALEFTPFWLQAHPHMTNYKFFGIDTLGRNRAFSQARLFSLSLAFINKDTTTNIGKLNNHNAALGIRTTLVRIFSSGNRNKIVTIARQWDMALAGLLAQLHGETPTVEQLNAIAERFKYADSIKKYMAEPALFSLDAAAAGNVTFPSNTFSSHRVSRAGVWLNANLSVPLGKNSPDNYLTFSGLARYIHAKDSLDTQGSYISSNLFDAGLKTSLRLGGISLAYEYVHRASSDKTAGSTYKSVGLVNYKIKDGVFITGAFGQNFPTVNNLITTIGINWGISNGKEKIE